VSTSRQTSNPRRQRWRRGFLIGALVVVVLAVVTRLILDPVAAHFTRRVLAHDLTGYRGAFEYVHVALLPPSFTITHLKIIEHPKGVWKEPLFYADRVNVGIAWRKLIHAAVVARIRVDGPKIVIARDHERKQKEEVPGLGAQAQKISPLRLDRVEIRDGEILYAESPASGSPRLWLHGIEAAIENIATREALAEGRPTTTTVSAVVQKSGQLTAFVSADPFAKGLTFAGRVSLEHLDLRDLYSFLAEKSDVQAKRGTLELFAEFQAKDGHLTGGVKPVLENVEIGPADGKLVDRLKAWFADKAVELASDRVPGRKAVATVIPIRGTVSNPHVQLVPAILGVVRNAFVVGLTSGFAYVPPPVAEEKKGVLGQVKDALKGKPGPPPAQPERGPAEGRKSKSVRPEKKAP
jgi:Domain of Unknown Function (DUF748)